MFKRRFALTWALVFAFFAQSTQAFWDTPYITPVNPTAGETVSINVHMGVCDTIFYRDGFPQITQNGNAIRIVVYGQHWEDGNELCGFPTGTGTFPVGTFPPGQYTVTFELFYIDFFTNPQILTLGVVPLTVAGSAQPAVPAPALNVPGLLALIVVIAGLAVWAVRTRRSGIVLIVLVCVPLARAQVAPANRTVEILLTHAPGAPTPAQLVNYYAISPHSGSPPLQAFTITTPQVVQYLIPDRASGDFLAWQQANPNSARTKLEAIVLATFASSADVPAALTALRADPYVANAYEPLAMQPSSVSLTDFSIDTDPLGNGDQYGWYDLNIDAAWQMAGGYALVGQIDYGLYVDHPALRQFTSSTSAFTGGNFIKAASKDVSQTGQTPPSGFDATNVDEAKPLVATGSPCTSLVPAALGHGTHVAGLLAANGASGQGVQGTCKHCGISAWKVGQPLCDAIAMPPYVYLNFNTPGANRGQVQAVDTGSQVNSMSFGVFYGGNINYCSQAQGSSSCLAIAYAMSRDTAMVAASGNDRRDLNFPASDSRVISAGGFQQSLALWNDSPPDTTTNCPHTTDLPPGHECGSNYSITHSGSNYFGRQEVLASSKAVLSTTYPHFNYQDYAHCGDGYQVSGTAWGNGIGLCTGTSMSAPQAQRIQSPTASCTHFRSCRT